MDAEKGKRLVREFLNVLHSGDADGALALATDSPKLFIFNNEVPDGFRMLAGIIPSMFDGLLQQFDGTAIKRLLLQNPQIVSKYFKEAP